MTAARFTNLEITSRSIDVVAVHSGASEEIHFEFSHDVATSPSLVALALSTLCGRAFNTVHFDFPVSDAALKQVNALTQAQVTAADSEEHRTRRREGCVLNFSGGFDSLAAYALMPENTKLVSMDFGGRFARERRFFERFSPLRVTTNILDSPLRRNSWSMMGIGAILAADELAAEYITFGSIMESSVDSLRATPSIVKAPTFPPFTGAGYTNAPFVLGLSEVGTAMVLLRNDPSLAVDSLISLASPGEEKLYRKKVLLDVVAKKFGIGVNTPEIPRPPRSHYPFGKAFTTDILALYVIANTGDPEAYGLVRDIPAGVSNAALTLDMSFLERVNPTLTKACPDAVMPLLAGNLGAFGITAYDEADWDTIKRLRGILGAFYPALQN